MNGIGRRLRIVSAGLRLWREQGTAGLVRRFLLRRGPRAPRVSRFRLFLATLRPRSLPAPRVTHPDIGASGRFALFLSDGILPAKGWLEAMAGLFDRRPECGAAGAKILDARGRLKSAGGIVLNGGVVHVGRGDDPNRPEYNYVREVDFCSGPLLVRRDALMRAGIPDETPVNEIDLCSRLRNSGASVWYQPAAHVYAVDGAHDDRPALDLSPQAMFRASDRNRGPVVLVIDHEVPIIDRDAGSVFMTRFLSTVAALGCRTIFWPHNLLRSVPYAALLQQEGIEVLYGVLDFDDYIRTYASEIAFAVVHRSSMAERYLPLLERAGVVSGYVAADLEHIREARRASVHGRSDDHGEVLKGRERQIVRAAKCVGVHSPIEAQILRDQLSARHVIELPLPVTRPRSDPRGVDGRAGLLFLGSTHQPNIDAVRYFAERLWPRIRERMGDVRLNIAGDVCAAVRDLARSPSIRLLGHVDDLARCFDESRVFVAPMRFGAGIKGKILEAMNHGIPVVTTPVGAEGIGLIHGETAMIAEDDDAFVQHVVDLHSNAEIWGKLQLAGRRLVQETLSDDAFRDAVDRFLSCLGKQPATHSRIEKHDAGGSV